MRFLFDYGVEWVFLVELIDRKPKEPKVRLPRLLIAAGKSAYPISGSRRRIARVNDRRGMPIQTATSADNGIDELVQAFIDDDLNTQKRLF